MLVVKAAGIEVGNSSNSNHHSWCGGTSSSSNSCCSAGGSHDSDYCGGINRLMVS